MGKPALIIVSQQVLFRRALAYLFSSGAQYEVTAECGGPDELPSGEQVTGYCLFIVDAELPDSQIHQVADFARNSHHKIVILGSVNNKQRLVKLMPLKADGYFTTDLSEQELPALLEKVERGGPVIADSLVPELVNKVSRALDENTADEGYASLTPREKEILKLLATGSTNGQIAKKLVISVSTVKNHVHNILDKLGINNRSQLVSYALTRGLV